MTEFSPREIVSELDRFIIGQADAKRAVAIALRNRWRRLQLDEKMREEVLPKNILMIGPTGVGKTEISRRLARLADELIDAARARRMDAEPVIRPRRLLVTLKIGEGPPIDRYDELVHCRLLKVLAHSLELLAGIAPPLPDVRSGQPATHQRQIGGRHREKLITRHHSFSIVTLRLV